jgi:DoxX-like family
MNQNKFIKVSFWTANLLFSMLMLFSVKMYLFNYETIKGFFVELGYPIYLIYPLAILKIIGVLVLIFNFNKLVTEWAYSAFFFELVLAFFAHFMKFHQGYEMALAGLILLLSSYFLGKKARNNG